MEDKKATLTEHLEEFRNRIIKCFIFIILATCLTYSFTDKILGSFIKPVGNLVFIAPAEAFVTNIKIAFFGGLFLASPFVAYQVWRFISVALKTDEKRHTLVFGPLSLVFFIAGASFGYFVIVPISIKFLLGFGSELISPMISVARYVSFVGNMVFAFGLVFQLPLAMLFLSKLGIVTPVFLRTKRRHAIVIIFILAAILTPPDVITQCLMAGPLIILYELGILFSKFAYNQSKLL